MRAFALIEFLVVCAIIALLICVPLLIVDFSQINDAPKVDRVEIPLTCQEQMKQAQEKIRLLEADISKCEEQRGKGKCICD